jgi:hypothetical protein
MSSSTSSSEAAKPAAKSASSARTFLAAMAGGLLATAAAFTLAPESWLHTGPEYGMSEAHQAHMQAACAAHETPDVLILGDSRAVAGLSVNDMRAAGIDADKFALGASGLFAGWSFLDRLTDCGVRPKNVVLAYGLVHLVDTGAIMDRTANFDGMRGPRSSFQYGVLADAEDRLSRRVTYKAVSILGTEGSGLDFVLLAPSIRRVLAEPTHALHNRADFVRERDNFTALNGDRYYGIDEAATELPQEKEQAETQVPRMNMVALERIAEMGRQYGFKVWFYMMPSTEMAMHGLDPRVIQKGENVLAGMPADGITPLNSLWSLPDSQFGDESHVNPRGRASVTADFLPRWQRHAEASLTSLQP